MTTTTTAAMATWTKLTDGTWGVRVNAPKVQVGDSITVTKKSGATSLETVSRVVWSGVAKDGRPACLVEIRTVARVAPRSGRGGYLAAARGVTCKVCGSAGQGRGDPCDDCGAMVR